MAKENPLRRIFDLYTSDMSVDEIERLVKRDAAEVYEFFSADIPKDDQTQNKFVRALIFVKSLFNAFLLKMSAGRRLLYIGAAFLFILGLINPTLSYIVLSFIILNVLLAFELADKLTAKDELSLAKKIQLDLIPENYPDSEHYEIATYYETAREVGGDYFDIIPMDNGTGTYLITGDISGKGMPAALYMVRLQTIIHYLIAAATSPKEIVIKLKQIFSRNLRKEYFLTLIVSQIMNDGSLKVCRAGHLPILHYKAKENEFVEINPKGIGIGFNDKGIFEKTIEEDVVKPAENDILLIYTDGLTESMNMSRRQFGMDNVKKIIGNNAGQSPEMIKERLLVGLERFKEGIAPNDDITMIILKAKNHS